MQHCNGCAIRRATMRRAEILAILTIRAAMMKAESLMPESEIMKTAEPKRNFFQTAVYNFFAMYLGVTPPAPGQEAFYAALLLAVVLCLIGGGYLIVRYLLGQMLG